MIHITCIANIFLIQWCCCINGNRCWWSWSSIYIISRFVYFFFIKIGLIWSKCVWMHWWINIFRCSIQCIMQFIWIERCCFCCRWWYRNITFRIVSVRWIQWIVILIFVCKIFIRWHLCVVRNFICEGFNLCKQRQKNKIKS